MAGLDPGHGDCVGAAGGTVFDGAVVRLLPTATLDRLRALAPRGRLAARRVRQHRGRRPRKARAWGGRRGWPHLTIGGGRLAIAGPCLRWVMVTCRELTCQGPGILRTAAQHDGVNVGVDASVISGGTPDDLAPSTACSTSTGQLHECVCASFGTGSVT